MKTKIDIFVIQRVKAMRIDLGLSQEQLSILAGFKSNSFVGQVESGNQDKHYNIRHVNLFAKIFNCSPKDFLPDQPI